MEKRKEKQKGMKPEAGFSQQGQPPAGAAPLSELDLSDGFLFGEVMRDEETCRTVLGIRPQCTGRKPGSEADPEACGGSKEK